MVTIGLLVLAHLPDRWKHLWYDVQLGTGSAGICCIVLQAPLIGILARSGLVSACDHGWRPQPHVLQLPFTAAAHGWRQMLAVQSARACGG